MSLKTILAALALESDTDPVAGRAMQLAAQHGARLLLVHVVETPRAGAGDLAAPLDDAALAVILEDQARERLTELAARARRGSGVEIVVRCGRADEVIDELAREHAAGLIVIGPGKARGVREKVFGSTADRLVRVACAPVLVVRSPVFDPYRRVIAAVDFSEPSQAVAEAAARVAPEAMVELVHVVEIPLGFEQAMRKAGTPQAEIEQYRRARAAAARRGLLECFPAAGRAPARMRPRVVQGDAAVALVRMARSGRTDLVALGTRGRNVAARFVLGSVARKVLLGASCDVLVSAG